METQPPINDNVKAIEAIDRLEDQIIELKRKSRADNTIEAYQSDFRHFAQWCDRNGFQALPASAKAVALYLTDIKDHYMLSTLERRLASISVFHN